MITSLKDTILDNKMLEKKRIDLSLRNDFCLTELFSIFDQRSTAYINLSDFQKFSYDNKIDLDTEDICIIIDRYDKDRDGMLSYNEFCNIFYPENSEYRNKLRERVTRKVFRFEDYCAITIGLLIDLMKNIIITEENFDLNKFRLSDGRVLSSDDIFGFLDKSRTGNVTMKEFGEALNEAGVGCSERDARILFEQFDRNKDGRITFDEFYSP